MIAILLIYTGAGKMHFGFIEDNTSNVLISTPS
ncbi:MAG: hypothetical protein RLZZ630_1886 [Bacteroidota bacterium]|jgi:hypothetical protein